MIQNVKPTMYSKHVETVSFWAAKQHRKVNHFYDDSPYLIHLDLVYSYGLKYINLIPVKDRETVLAACYTHDTIEDCRITYNDLKKSFGYYLAEITYAVSNEKGKTRKDRANRKYYKGIRNCKYATFVKLCDRLANMKYSQVKGSDMFNKYCNELPEFLCSLTPTLGERVKAFILRRKLIDYSIMYKELLELKVKRV